MTAARMDLSQPNEDGTLDADLVEVVARRGRAYAAVRFVWCEDRLYRLCVEMHCTTGGFTSPIYVGSPGFPTLASARIAGLEELLSRRHVLLPSDPTAVHDEVAGLRRQIENQLRLATQN